MTLQFMYDMGMQIVSWCQDFLNVFTMPLSDVLNSLNQLGDLSILGPIGIHIVVDFLVSQGYGSLTLFEFSLFGGLIFFVSFTLLKWILDLVL